MSRATARRPLFRDRQDLRYFLSRIAREVRRGTLEIHAWSLMTTHFHLLVRSPTGQLPEAMQRILNAYVRTFNRRYRRDGPLMRGRFVSKPVSSERYKAVLVQYIDHNPVSARLCSRPWDHAWGSARHFVEATSPRWHARWWVEAIVAAHAEEEEPFPSAYALYFGATPSAAQRAWVETLLARPGGVPKGFDDLVSGVPGAVRGWMESRAAVADGTALGEPVAEFGAVNEAAECEAKRLGPHRIDGREVDAAFVFRVSMGRLLACATWQQIAGAVGASLHRCRRAFLTHHARLWRECEDYAVTAERVTQFVTSSSLPRANTEPGSFVAREGVGGRSAVVPPPAAPSAPQCAASRRMGGRNDGTAASNPLPCHK